ncbi:MAG: amidinotransferase [Deltaproteobacteria bacterium]|nr:amidinotransferase [Deltaproteobacteria bacterium]
MEAFRRNRLISGYVVCFITFATFVFSANIYAQTVRVGQQAEWGHPKKILMHTPGDEVFMGILHPAAALYEKPFSLKIADAEHVAYIKRLRGQGAEVYRVVEILLEGTLDEQGRAKPGPELDALRTFAGGILEIDMSALNEEEKARQKIYKEKILSQLSPYELVKIILQRPVVHLRQTNTNTGLSATYEVAPVMNLYFLRDQMITTAKGVVISKMNSVQRAPETEIIKFVLKKMGITPVYEMQGKGRLEGGDYFSAGEVALIGQGLRTNAEGVRQLLENQVFGTPVVAVVKDNWKNQEEMHLDTYFNIIGPKLAVMVDLRMNIPGKEPELKGISSKVDIYRLGKDGYELETRDMNFQQYLEKELGFKIIPVSRKDQNLYGINFLTVAPKKIFAIDGVSKAYKQTLKENGVDATWMDFRELTKGYGAAHCTTQVLLRDNVSEDSKSGM